MENNAWTTQKMDGAGNSFIIISFPTEKSSVLYQSQMESKNLAQESVKLCQHHQVDGAVFLKDFQEFSPHYEWEFYNADGSVAEMCGNAARCVASFTVENKLAPQKHSFKTIAGSIAAEYISKEQTKIQTALISQNLSPENLELSQASISFYSVNSGVPHAVIPNHSVEPTKIKSLAQSLRSHDHFKPQGTNVSFYQEIKPGLIKAISFERGVEDFTLACGTGAVAVATIYKNLNSFKDVISVQMPGGLLQVDLPEKDSPWLIGPVRYL